MNGSLFRFLIFLFCAVIMVVLSGNVQAFVGVLCALMAGISFAAWIEEREKR